MREIKFRVWSVARKQWISDTKNWPYSVTYSFGNICNPLRVHSEYGGEFEYYLDDYVIQQYTGLKDQNGVEIYEGDIINYTIKGFYNTSLVTWYEFMGCWGLMTKAAVDLCECHQIKVIGNLYENPELLKL